MAVVATGFFDGVHKGHRLVVETLVRSARERGEESLILTFWPHPRTVLGTATPDFRLLNTLSEKTALLKSLGVDRVEVLEFTRDFSLMSAKEFLSDVVKARFGGTAVLLGYDNRIGHEPFSPAQTSALAKECCLDVIRTPEVQTGSTSVSSTRIRAALQGGDVQAAASMLGYDYTLEGEVVHGKQLGRTIGFPTANMLVADPMKLIPAQGVYLSRVSVGGECFYGMTNIGPDIETHIFLFEGDIYGQTIRVSLLRKIREELRFGSIDELRSQLQQDEANCRLELGKLK